MNFYSINKRYIGFTGLRGSPGPIGIPGVSTYTDFDKNNYQNDIHRFQGKKVQLEGKKYRIYKYTHSIKLILNLAKANQVLWGHRAVQGPLECKGV